jgi:hypothetical protein
MSVADAVTEAVNEFSSETRNSPPESGGAEHLMKARRGGSETKPCGIAALEPPLA